MEPKTVKLYIYEADFNDVDDLNLFMHTVYGQAHRGEITYLEVSSKHCSLVFEHPYKNQNNSKREQAIFIYRELKRLEKENKLTILSYELVYVLDETETKVG